MGNRFYAFLLLASIAVGTALIVTNLHLYYNSNQSATLQATDQGYKLYGMDYPFEGHHRQVYVIARSEAQAREAANQPITSIRRIDVPILIVREKEK